MWEGGKGGKDCELGRWKGWERLKRLDGSDVASWER